MVKLGKCNRSCNVVDDLCTKMCVLIETKDINVKVFNIITKINEVKTLVNLFHANLNANLTVQLVIQNKNWIVINVNVGVKSIVHAKNI